MEQWLILSIAWTVILICVLTIFAVIFWLWTLIDCLRSDLPTDKKFIWVLVIALFSIIGSILYLVFGKDKDTKLKSSRKLYRSSKNRVIAGVCGGIGEYANIDPTVIRLAWIILTLFGGSGIVAYLIAWAVIPINPS